MNSSDIDNQPFPCLFAEDTADIDLNKVGSARCGFTYAQGIPSMYSSRQGKKVNRADMNGLGRAISQAKIFNQYGGYYTYDNSVSDMIGGYPLGAILHYKDSLTGKIRIVRSFIENNEFNFVENPEFIDGTRWAYVDEVKPTSFRPRIFASSVSESGSLRCENSQALGAVKSVFCSHDSLMIIQSGINEDECQGEEGDQDFSDTGGEIIPGSLEKTAIQQTERIFWFALVQRYGEEEYHDAACLGCLLPEGEGYEIMADSLNSDDMALSHFTSFYSSSPVQIYLKAGDRVRVSSSTSHNGIDPVFKYKLIRLVS